MDYDRVRALYRRRFPAGDFTGCDWRPHFDGFGYNAFALVRPRATPETTLAMAHARLAVMCAFFRRVRRQFGPGDRIQLTVGFPESVRRSGRILRAWLPTARLTDLRPPDFAAVGGGFGEEPD